MLIKELFLIKEKSLIINYNKFPNNINDESMSILIFGPPKCGKTKLYDKIDLADFKDIQRNDFLNKLVFKYNIEKNKEALVKIMHSPNNDELLINGNIALKKERFKFLVSDVNAFMCLFQSGNKVTFNEMIKELNSIIRILLNYNIQKNSLSILFVGTKSDLKRKEHSNHVC